MKKHQVAVRHHVGEGSVSIAEVFKIWPEFGSYKGAPRRAYFKDIPGVRERAEAWLRSEARILGYEVVN